VAYTEVMFAGTSPQKSISPTISNNITTDKAGSRLAPPLYFETLYLCIIYLIPNDSLLV
jgi:hypothetical protein